MTAESRRCAPRRWRLIGTVTVGEDIDVAPFLDQGVTPLAVNRLTRHLEERFNLETDAHERQPGTGT